MELHFLLLQDGRRLDAVLIQAPDSRDGKEREREEALPHELAPVHPPALTKVGDDVRHHCFGT